MGTINRVILIVLDSVGIGALPEAEAYGDAGSNTLGNIARAVGGLELPNLDRLGLERLCPHGGTLPPDTPRSGAYGRMRERSPGKDTTTGHWEMVGIVLDKPFPVYPNGFPPVVIEAFEQQTSRPVLGNRAASGTRIIEELGEAHVQTGYPIVYTSADSVFQIAAHEEIIPLPELYRMCETARAILQGEHAVGRVIARPFKGTPGAFVRTANRRDFSLRPSRPTVLELAEAAGCAVIGIGKIEDIFSGAGITRAIHTHNNEEGIEATIGCMQEDSQGLIFTNLVDFDMLYGHRNDAAGYARALEAFDRRLPEIIDALRPGDCLILTADHGCDPTTDSTDHSREYVPLLVTGQAVRAGAAIAERESFADLGATIAQLLDLPPLPTGKSFAAEVLKIREGER